MNLFCSCFMFYLRYTLRPTAARTLHLTPQYSSNNRLLLCLTHIMNFLILITYFYVSLDLLHLFQILYDAYKYICLLNSNSKCPKYFSKNLKFTNHPEYFLKLLMLNIKLCSCLMINKDCTLLEN